VRKPALFISEIGIRREHDIEAAVGFEAFASLLKQGCHVPIVRAGVPAPVR
jgi:hypothetical protein